MDVSFLGGPCPQRGVGVVAAQLEAELRIPVISANQVTMWAALRRLGTRAVGPYQALLDEAARAWPQEQQEHQEREGWT